MKELKVRLTFTEELLGTASSNPDIHREFIASKAENAETIEDEVAAIGVDAAIMKDTTIFPTDEQGKAFIYDYQIRGFFKEACGILKKIPGTLSAGEKAFKKKIDGLIFVNERQIPLNLPQGKDFGNCQRPLRAQTMQGERISLANSITAPADTWIEFTVKCLIDKDIDLVKEWLEYGELKGLGQWRNSGKGRFTVEYI